MSVTGFSGYRMQRMHAGGSRLVSAASSLWDLAQGSPALASSDLQPGAQGPLLRPFALVLNSLRWAHVSWHYTLNRILVQQVPARPWRLPHKGGCPPPAPCQLGSQSVQVQGRPHACPTPSALASWYMFKALGVISKWDTLLTRRRVDDSLLDRRIRAQRHIATLARSTRVHEPALPEA